MSGTGPRGDVRQRTIAAKLDADQMARFERAVAASGMSNSAFIRAAVLDQAVPLRPFEPLMAEALATLATCRTAFRERVAVDAALLRRLDLLIDALHRVADMRAP